MDQSWGWSSRTGGVQFTTQHYQPYVYSYPSHPQMPAASHQTSSSMYGFPVTVSYPSLATQYYGVPLIKNETRSSHSKWTRTASGRLSSGTGSLVYQLTCKSLVSSKSNSSNMSFECQEKVDENNNCWEGTTYMEESSRDSIDDCGCKFKRFKACPPPPSNEKQNKYNLRKRVSSTEEISPTSVNRKRSSESNDVEDIQKDKENKRVRKVDGHQEVDFATSVSLDANEGSLSDSQDESLECSAQDRSLSTLVAANHCSMGGTMSPVERRSLPPNSISIKGRPKRILKRVISNKSPFRMRKEKALGAAIGRAHEVAVFKYLLELEKRYVRTPSYVTTHPSINQRTRAILVDWLIQVQTYMNLCPETLYQSVGLVDRVLELRDLSIQRLQLLAVVSVLIISKLEEKKYVEPATLLNLTLNSYTKEELFLLERWILKAINFELTFTDPTIFIRYFLHLGCFAEDQKTRDCAGFLVDNVLTEIWPLETRPSLIGAGAVYGALYLLHGTSTASSLLHLFPDYFKLSEGSIFNASLKMLDALAKRHASPYQGANKKYSSRSRHNALSRDSQLEPTMIQRVASQIKAAVKLLES